MIIKNVCLLLEALSIVICLHHLYGEKFRLDIATVSFLSINMIIMTAINYFEIARIQTMVIYLIIILYCGIRFGFKAKPMVINTILCIILVGGIQIFGILIVYCFYGVTALSDYKLLLANSVTCVIVLLILPFLKINRLSKILQDKEEIVIITVTICLIVSFAIILRFKKIRLMGLINSVTIFLCVLFIFILVVKMVRYKIRATEIETELKMHKLYSESFQSLVDDIRLRQHEFDNHINTIYSLHYSCHTLEELIEAQESYCGKITKENRFSKLISHENSVIRGFLYTKFVKIDKMGIDISYQVTINESDVGIPIYKLVEILGDLINNAVEALMVDEKRNRLYVSIMNADKFCIEVMNESSYISYDMLSGFFTKGYSKKGENRGLGLYNVKQICEKYGLEIAPEWREIDGIGWLSFKVWKVG